MKFHNNEIESSLNPNSLSKKFNDFESEKKSIDQFRDKEWKNFEALNEESKNLVSSEDSLSFILGLFLLNHLDKINESLGFNLSPEEIKDSVKRSSDFFNLNEPKDVREDWTTAVILGIRNNGIDDIILFNKEQLNNLGITDKEGFDLVMTHEGCHRAIHDKGITFTDHEEELCCDFMSGVRAGLNGLDNEKISIALESSEESITHPDGLLRGEAIRGGVQFAQEYLAINNEAPTFSICIERFNKKLGEIYGNAEKRENINLKKELENKMA